MPTARLVAGRSSEVLETRLLLATTPFNIDDFPSLPTTVAVGAGSLTTAIPDGEASPPAVPNFTDDFSGPLAAAEWWSSIGFSSSGSSFNVHSHPLATFSHDEGLAIGYPRDPTVTADGYQYPFDEDLRVTLNGLTSTGAKVADYSDWTVTTRWQDGADRLEATFGHGLPFIYFTRQGAEPVQAIFDAAITVWSNDSGVAGITIGDKHYGLFAPADSIWTQTGDTLENSLNGRDYFSIAVLPDNLPTTLEFYRQRAYAFVTDTAVSWQYDASTSRATATYTATTELQEAGNGNVNQTLMAMYRHQWLNSATPVTSHRYDSSRGEMKVVDGNAFNTSLIHHGTLPLVPEIGADPSRLYDYIDELYQQPSLLTTTDTYFTATNSYKLAQLIPLAEQVGHLEARERFLYEVRTELEDWFSADDDGEGLFYYDRTWGSLIGYPDSFGSADSLNDHHFHYGYFVQSAAIVAMYDPEWAKESNWGGMVELLIRDVANWERDDATFQTLRYFDVYAGHSWASGNATFGKGNNQESSSEAMNFANGLIMWGSVTGEDAIRDLGIYIATTHTAAIEQYWMDIDDVVFPAGYQHPIAGIVWSDGVDYATFFSGSPELIQGINYLPLNGGSLYLGHDPAYVQAGYDHVVSENGGPVDDWTDLMASYLAFADPEQALADFDANPADAIQPLAKNYHWISSLKALGNVDPTVTADIPSYAVFDKSGVKTYVGYNPTGTPLTATYSDGTEVSIPAFTYVATGGNQFTWTPNPALQPTPPENRLFVIDRQTAAATASLKRSVGLTAETDELPNAAGGTHFDTPVNPVVYAAEGISGTYDAAKQTLFNLYLDAGTTAGNMTQVRISYDFNGDGQYDRREVYGGLATDAADGWENYNQDRGTALVTGTYEDFVGGSVVVEAWSVFGAGGVHVRTSANYGEAIQSIIDIPFTAVTQTETLDAVAETSAISENGGTTIVTVSRSGNTAAALDVTLTSSDTSQAVVPLPSTVTIASGQVSAVFTVNAVNDSDVDGDHVVNITASADGFPDRTVQITVQDDEFNPAIANTLHIIDGAVSPGSVGLLSPDAGSGELFDTVPETPGNHLGTPFEPLVYESSGISGKYDSSQVTRFSLYLDAGSNVGSATQSRVSYDFDGDGTYDRLETYNFFATNPVTDWERYRETAGIQAESGAFADMVNGTVKLELWKGFGAGDTDVRTSATPAEGQQSLIQIPFTGLVRALPDLSASAFSVTDNHVLKGQAEVVFTIQNEGTVAASMFTTQLVWSPNDILGDSDDVLVAGSDETFASLAGAETATRTISVQLDRAALYARSLAADEAGLAAGAVSQDISRLFLVVDANNDVAEADEFNNADTGHRKDRESITYFPWDLDGNGTVTPIEALHAIQAINTSNVASDFDGNGIVTPLEALSVLQRIGYVRNDAVSSKTAGKYVGSSVAEVPETSTPATRAAWLPTPTTSRSDEDDDLFAAKSEAPPQVLPVADEDWTELDVEFETTNDWLSVI